MGVEYREFFEKIVPRHRSPHTPLHMGPDAASGVAFWMARDRVIACGAFLPWRDEARTADRPCWLQLIISSWRCTWGVVQPAPALGCRGYPMTGGRIPRQARDQPTLSMAHHSGRQDHLHSSASAGLSVHTLPDVPPCVCRSGQGAAGAGPRPWSCWALVSCPRGVCGGLQAWALLV